MKFILLLTMCSYSTGACLPPYEWPTKFDSGYECSIAGYAEAARKLKEMGLDPADVHAGNIMVRSGTKDVVFVDLGLFSIGE